MVDITCWLFSEICLVCFLTVWVNVARQNAFGLDADFLCNPFDGIAETANATKQINESYSFLCLCNHDDIASIISLGNSQVRQSSFLLAQQLIYVSIDLSLETKIVIRSRTTVLPAPP